MFRSACAEEGEPFLHQVARCMSTIFAGFGPTKLQLGRFWKNKRAVLPQPSLAGTAATASARLLHMVQHHKARGTKRISVPSRGLHTAAALPASLQPTAAIVGHSAALGVCKCLPYELPLLTNEPIDYDAASAGLTYGCDADMERGDMYGVAMSANTLTRPLMLYRSASGASTGSAAIAPSSTYIITGKALIAHEGFAAHFHVRCRLVSRENDLLCRLNSQGSSMCTGGTAGLGLLTASYMVASGAARLILLGRTGRCANATDMRMLADEGCRACVTLLRADVSGLSEAENAVATAHCAPARLGGLLHAAGLQA